MGLPNIPSARSDYDFEGTKISCRSLTRSEAMKMTEYQGNQFEAEAFVISCGTDTPIDVTKTWLESTDAGLVDGLLTHILEVSRLIDGSQKRN